MSIFNVVSNLMRCLKTIIVLVTLSFCYKANGQQKMQPFFDLKGKLNSPVGPCNSVYFETAGCMGTKSIDRRFLTFRNSKALEVNTISDGFVSAVSINEYGNLVMIKNGQFILVYSNLNSIYIKKGDRVTAGQRIGSMGTSYYEDGSFELNFMIYHKTQLVRLSGWFTAGTLAQTTNPQLRLLR
jgi:hypothetical protein